MKKIILPFTVLMLLVLACEKQESEEISIEGVYKGYITPLQSQSFTSEVAEAEVSIIGDHLLEIHCYSESLDTLLHLNYYKNNNEYMVCFTGEDFLHMYGHSMNFQHMPSNMMGYETEWMYHLATEHIATDEHFGKFGMMNNSFEYFFQPDQHHPYKFQFHGNKR